MRSFVPHAPRSASQCVVPIFSFRALNARGDIAARYPSAGPGRLTNRPFVRKVESAVMQPKLAFLPECQRGGPKLLEEVFEDGAKGRAGGAGVAKVTSMTEPVS